MLQRAMKEIRDDAVLARDGRVGSVKDVYFDDERWAVRYLVVDTGEWIPGREVLISPASLPRQEGGGEYLRVGLTREEVRNAPDTSAEPPISRLEEAAHADYYGYPYYWAGPYLWGTAPVPVPPQARPEPRDEMREAAAHQARHSHLRSGAEVVGYRIRAADGEIGHVEDFLVDDESWAITGMVVDTRNWLPGKHVLVPPGAIGAIDWSSREVSVRLKREELEHAPEAP